ncbi:O-antigen ligase family protein [Staphylococcus simiae]|uniref:O-antigen ligase family protein n=1 Tax=Staphylococcus simiae TaxID=308354 RepID=UPI001A98BE00|nr:O-antigen ligase family protein [Staphylococcus simiae]MBO1198295.1 O-antigen ligase family protein [Staphylococcus simiae]MBO1201970.1 O-antigen ligase family protein [Staphylococcus simiae]MBO1204198.1 O-antigen ligase family protein [Staphylococcus simiae]MBO1210287.1 O-antigen ligase family protein [Staphylococcus simiae]MBO1230432.1 O-antigen ligase family protein [Staphylococcus simiae]
MEASQKKDRTLKFLIICLAIFIQQSSVIADVNISIADFITVILIIYIALFYSNQFKFNLIVQFMIALFVYRLLITLYFLLFNEFVSVSFKEIIASTVKFSFIVVYFLLAYIIFNLSEYNMTFIRTYIMSSTIIGMLCILAGQLKIGIIMNIFFFDEIRSKGLMNDPNYFAMAQIITFIFVFKFIKNNILKMVVSLILIASIFTTGSKTALIILILLSLFYLLVKIFSGNVVHVITILLLIMASIIMVFIFYNFKAFNINFTDTIPSIERMTSIFQNGRQSIDDSGSNRSLVWWNAISLIKYSYGFGIGLVDYVHLGSLLNGIDLVAHNTYLQIAVEWGLLFAIVFVGYLIYIFVKLLANNTNQKNLYLICILGVLMLYFMTVSFNNSRYVAFIIGLLSFMVSNKKARSVYHDK